MRWWWFQCSLRETPFSGMSLMCIVAIKDRMLGGGREKLRLIEPTIFLQHNKLYPFLSLFSIPKITLSFTFFSLFLQIYKYWPKIYEKYSFLIHININLTLKIIFLVVIISKIFVHSMAAEYLSLFLCYQSGHKWMYYYLDLTPD